MGIKNISLLILFISIAMFLSGWVSSKAIPRKPVNGLLQGKDGYAWWNRVYFGSRHPSPVLQIVCWQHLMNLPDISINKV